MKISATSRVQFCTRKKKVGIKRASGHKGAATATCGYFNPIQVQLSKNKLRPKIS